MPVPDGEKLFVAQAKVEPRRWLFFILPVVGGLLSGIIVYWFAPEAEGHGTDAMIDSFHNKGGQIRARVPFVKGIATIITLASGGSAGREGPIAQIGSGIGVWVANLLRLSVHDRRILLLAGTAGGLGAIFRAPLGGAITACEVIYKEDLETDALLPAVISFITAYTIFSQVFGFKPIFGNAAYSFDDPRQLIFYIILGLICVPLGMLYIRVFYAMRDRGFKKIPLPNWTKPMIGGLIVGLIGLWVPEVYSGGWGQLQNILHGKIPSGSITQVMTWPEFWFAVKFMAGLALFKILATSATIGSGGSGGVFGPTLFIGGMLGGVVGLVALQVSPPGMFSSADVGAFVLVGMAAFFAGVANAPLGALLMVTEMTEGYGLITPLLLVSAIALMFTRRWSIYENQVKNKFSSPAHVGEFTVNVLEEMRVLDVFEPKEWVRSVRASASFYEVQQQLAYEDAELLPVARKDGTLVGLISLDSTKPILFEDGLEDLLIAEDLAIPATHVHPEDSLYDALLEFLKYPIHGILVTDQEDPNKILGVLHHRDLIQAYNNEIITRKGK